MSEFTKENIGKDTAPKKGSLHLSLQVDGNELVAASIDSEKKKLTDIDTFNIVGSSAENQSYWLGNLLKGNKFFKRDFESVDVALMGLRNTFIPMALFEEKLKKNYLELFFDLDEKDDAILKDYMVSLKSMNLYASSKLLINAIKSIYPNAQFKHFSSVFVEFLLRLNKTNDEKAVYVHIYPSRLDIAIIKGYQLLYHNSFENESVDGWLYYILFITEQLEIDLNKIQFVFLGTLDKQSKEWSLVKSYLPKADFFDPSYKLKRSDGVKSFPEHRYHILLNQAQCV